MDDKPRIVDLTPLIEAAKADAGREGARYVRMSVTALWQLIHQAPMAHVQPDGLAAVPKAR